MRAIDRDLIRGRHYGQRSFKPHQQAEQMAATDQRRDVGFSLPRTGLKMLIKSLSVSQLKEHGDL